MVANPATRRTKRLDAPRKRTMDDPGHMDDPELLAERARARDEAQIRRPVWLPEDFPVELLAIEREVAARTGGYFHNTRRA